MLVSYLILLLLKGLVAISNASSPGERDPRRPYGKDPYDFLSPAPDPEQSAGVGDDLFDNWIDGGLHDRGYGVWESNHPHVWDFAPVSPRQVGLPVNPKTTESISTNIRNKEMLALQKAYAAGKAPGPMNKAAERVERNVARAIAATTSSGERKHQGLLSRLAQGTESGSGSASGSRGLQKQTSNLIRQGSSGRSSSGGSSRGSPPPEQAEVCYSPQRQSFNRGQYFDPTSFDTAQAQQQGYGQDYGQGSTYGTSGGYGASSKQGYTYGQQQGYSYNQGSGHDYGGIYGCGGSVDADEGHRPSIHSKYGLDNALDPLQQTFVQSTTEAMSGMSLGDYGMGGGGMGGLYEIFGQKGFPGSGSSGHRQSIDVRGGEFEQQYDWSQGSAPQQHSTKGGSDKRHGGEGISLQFYEGRQKYKKKEPAGGSVNADEKKAKDEVRKSAKAMLRKKMEERGTPLKRGVLDYRFTLNQNDRINALIMSNDEAEVQEALDAYNHIPSAGYNTENRKTGMISRKAGVIHIGIDGLCYWARKAGPKNVNTLINEILALERVPPAGPDHDAARAFWTPLVQTRTNADIVKAIRSPQRGWQMEGLKALVDEEYARFLQSKWQYWEEHPQMP